jgi:hypothetical protein
LDGVLLAGGQWVRSAGTARLSVLVADRWRAEALAEEFGARGVGCPDGELSIGPAENGQVVRTGFSVQLAPYAQSWTRGARQGPPPGFALSPSGLRLWCLACGRAEASGYLLTTAEPDDAVHVAAGAALARLGVPAVSLSHARLAGGAPGWRVSSGRRLRRLLELVGPAPDGAGPDWPNAH